MIQQEKTPTWAKWTLVICILCIICLFAYIAHQGRSQSIKDKESHKVKITRQIDSLTLKRDQKHDSVVTISDNTEKKAKKIIKFLPKNEPIHIPDTTGDYAVDYVRRFRADR